MKAKDLVVGKQYTHDCYPGEVAVYEQCIPKGEFLEGEHVFSHFSGDVEPFWGWISDDKSVESNINEVKENYHESKRFSDRQSVCR